MVQLGHARKGAHAGVDGLHGVVSAPTTRAAVADSLWGKHSNTPIKGRPTRATRCPNAANQNLELPARTKLKPAAPNLCPAAKRPGKRPPRPPGAEPKRVGGSRRGVNRQASRWT
jgi:hypothetical protein